LPVSHATVYLNNLLAELFEKKTKGKDYRKNPLIEADAWLRRRRSHKRDLCKTSSFAQSLRQAQILILKIPKVFLWLKSSR